MAGHQDIELSLEETNKLRIKLGLRPIPTPTDSKSTDPTPVEKSQHVENNNATQKDTKESNRSSNQEISLEETNRLRVSLGLKPIPESSATTEPSASGSSTSYADQEEQAYKNWKQLKDLENSKKRQESVQEKIIEKKEEAARRRAVNSAKSLTENAGNESTLDWIKKMQNAQKQNTTGGLKVSSATSKNKKQATKSPTPPEYSSEDINGLKVAHDIEEIELGKDVVLTLKDRSVLDDEEDVLESADLVAQEQLKKRLDAKKGLNRLNYDDDDESRGILSKYDELNKDGKESLFTLNSSSVVIPSKSKFKSIGKSANKGISKKPADKTKLKPDLGFSDIVDMFDTSSTDYQNALPGGKAPKIKKKKKKAMTEAQAVDIKASMSRKRRQEEEQQQEDGEEGLNFPADDDEQLQSILAISRRKVQRANKKKKIETPQEIAEKLGEEKGKEEEDEWQGQTGTNSITFNGDSAIVVNKTTDFLAGIKQASLDADNLEAKAKESRVHFSLVPSTSSTIKDTKEDESQHEDETDTTTNSGLKVDASVVAPDAPVVGGLAAALNLLKSRGLIKEKTAEQLAEEENNKRQRAWAKEMAKEKIIRDIELSKKREKIRATSGYEKLSQKDKEALAQKENHERELLEAKEAQKRFENYKPEIRLEYRDDDGRVLSTKDAYRHLSHQFHGIGPGKGKIEKQLKRDEEEKKRLSKSLFGNDDDKNNGPVYGVRLQ